MLIPLMTSALDRIQGAQSYFYRGMTIERLLVVLFIGSGILLFIIAMIREAMKNKKKK